jgi:hypothetical protein
VWSSHPGTVASLKEEGSRLNGEIAWVMHVMGYSDLAVDTRLSNHKAQDQINLNKTGKTDLQIRTRGLILIRDRIRIKGPIRIKVRMLQIQIILRQLPENPSLEISQGILIRIETGTATGTGIGIDQIKVRKVQEIHQKTPKF